MSSSGVTIEDLMRRALQGDAKAYNIALQEIVKVLSPYLSRQLSENSDIEDVLQEVLISVHKYRHTYDGKRPFYPWLFSIAHHRLSDHLRKFYADKLRSAAHLNELDHARTLNAPDIAESYYTILPEIEKLSGKQAEILRLLHNDGYTAKEAAVNLGMQESAVKVAAHRAYHILRKKLVK